MAFFVNIVRFEVTHLTVRLILQVSHSLFSSFFSAVVFLGFLFVLFFGTFFSSFL